MSVMFGTYHFDGSRADGDLHCVSSACDDRALDLTSSFFDHEVAVLHGALRTTKESHHERQPYITESRAVVAWDGRLDNRDQLIQQLGSGNLPGLDDLSIVCAAYERWGTGCFPNLLGDWAIAICDRTNRSVLLAKDFIGTRPLFYTIEKGRAMWSTLLDTLVRFIGHPFDLEAEFIAGLLSTFPATHLTP
jgi:asparagine synthase (glutamine-hydrolysing)